MFSYTVFDTSLCRIVLVGNENGLTNLHMDTGEGRRSLVIKDSWTRSPGLFRDIRKQIEEYLEGTRKVFSVPLNPLGTPFQKKVWQVLGDIPYGEVRTYKEVATSLGNPNGARAVGMAAANNPIPVIIPCHRVVGTNGSLTGFAFGLGIKQALLDTEQQDL
ncbi:methylated-DNA--[protein]-cysteine S-methyltransferase [Desulfoplanes formicivorans]|uniref:Methylated-DNA--protein-cysteine methyltransferase n=1 Tax=Desulfoplanes formicivorans TaxID=1592317 RepID=A0A194AHF8_9BACT|nr:methylated-DNA--[protein]-cysteine S-methyltransferase [Desulfoplanes formicivorans]GAU08521.1 cysteine methyltransferase [Desulfoplanes formicivorans]